MVFLDNISFSYGEDDHALEEVTLNIPKGEFLCIAGTNGSGKSTLARHINTLLRPTHGSVRILGMDTSDPQNAFAIRKEAAMVFQNPDDSLVASTVEDEIAFGPGNMGVAPEELRKRVADCLRAGGMAGSEKRDVNTLSGGQKQRIAIAGALAMAPSILILDEATSMLDPEGRRTVMGILRSLHQQGMTIVMITHFMEEALEADRIILMKDGRIEADGAPSQILSNKELIEHAGLAQPQVARLSTLLRNGGKSVPLTCNEDQLKEALCNLLSTR